MILAGRGVPKIHGSSGGFIALVVCLSVLIVGLCVAVYILLRDRSPTDEERAIRRQLSQRRREQQQSDLSSPFTYSSSSVTPVSLPHKIGSMFGMGTTADEHGGRKTKKGVKGGRGWMQAGSGDDWETHSNGENEMQKRSLSSPQTQTDAGHGHRVEFAIEDSRFDPPQLPYARTNSTSSVLLYSSSTPPPLRTPITRLQTTDSLSPSSATSLASSAAARALSGSPEPHTRGSVDDTYLSGDRHFSLQSSGSVSTRTSHTGTKFIESLE